MEIVSTPVRLDDVAYVQHFLNTGDLYNICAKAEFVYISITLLE